MGQLNFSLSGDCWFVIITYCLCVGQFNLSLSSDCWFVIITYVGQFKVLSAEFYFHKTILI